MVKGYKVFNSDWSCRGYQFTCPGVFTEDVKPMVCDRGFHFCLDLNDCFEFYSFNADNKVAEVIALGEVDTDGKKSCTDKIEIVREVPWDEVLRIVNVGKDCTGRCNTGNCNTGNWNTGNRNTGDWNTGDRNTGDRNTGDRNTGDRNTGDWNTGDRNTGDRNTGNWNTGDWNTGDWNTGNWNTGDWNTGDWNTGDRNTGCFMTEEQPIMMFNKPTTWSYRDWLNSRARMLLNQIPKNVVEWVRSEDMTDEEKAEHPTHETTCGYLKVLNESECGQLWWGSLTEGEKEVIWELPNFDAEIFRKCTGVDVRGDT